MGVASSSMELSLSYCPGILFFRPPNGFNMCRTRDVIALPWSSTGRVDCLETCRIKVGLGLLLRYMGSSKYLYAPFLSSADEPSPDWSVEIRGPGSSLTRVVLASSSASLFSLVATPSYQVSIASSGLSGKHSLGKIFGNSPPVSGSMTVYFSTALCMKGTCSSGPSSSCIVCHVTKPCFFSAGIVGGP